MRIIGLVLALAIGLSTGGCNRGLLTASAGGSGSRQTNPAKILIESTLEGMGYREVTQLSTSSGISDPHGLNAYFQAKAMKGEVRYRVSGLYDPLVGVIVLSISPTT